MLGQILQQLASQAQGQGDVPQPTQSKYGTMLQIADQLMAILRATQVELDAVRGQFSTLQQQHDAQTKQLKAFKQENENQQTRLEKNKVREEETETTDGENRGTGGLPS